MKTKQGEQSRKTWKTQGKIRENFYTSFQLSDTITMFGSSIDHIWSYSINLLI